MFTGLIEEIGTVKSITNHGVAASLTISATKVLSDLKIDNSIAVNGVCLTVVKVDLKSFEAEAVEETMNKTTLRKLSVGSKVNLERALTLSTRLGGHLVLGHVDATGKIKKILKQNLGTLFTLSFPKEFSKYIVQTGSVCIDGVSLTLAGSNSDSLTVSIIPYTMESSIIKSYNVGTEVNLEFDIIGKYVEKMVKKDNNVDDKLKEFLMS